MIDSHRTLFEFVGWYQEIKRNHICIPHSMVVRTCCEYHFLWMCCKSP